MHAGGDRLVGAHRFGTSSQDAGVPGLEAQRRGVGGDVGARLVNDADHAQGDAHLADLDARGLLLQFADFADGVRELRDLLQALGHRFDALRCEGEPVDEGRVLAGGAGAFHVVRVRGNEPLRVAHDRGGGGEQRAVLGCRVGTRDLARRRARAPADREHVGLDVRRSVHGEILPPGENERSYPLLDEEGCRRSRRGGLASVIPAQAEIQRQDSLLELTAADLCLRSDRR